MSARTLAHVATPTTTTTVGAGTETTSLLPPLVSGLGLTDDAAATSTTPMPMASSHLRHFAAIVCRDCLYLEFPGCDIHGVLYTERVIDERPSGAAATAAATPAATTASTTTAGVIAAATTSAAALGAPSSSSSSTSIGARMDSGPASAVASTGLHAKCPKCVAATNNVRPFRDGCRRCKAPTSVQMWCATPSEIAGALEAFPVADEELPHTALLCELCQSVVFPRAREALTRRTHEHAMASTNGKALQVSNFQLSMPHVEGCPRKGKPLKTVGIQLTRSELKFVLERIDQCPLAAQIQGGPQYRKRRHLVVTQQDSLHQIYIRLLGSVVKAFDPHSPQALAPLRQILSLCEHVEPMSMFSDWSPLRVLAETTVKPSRVEACSELNDQHRAENVLKDDDEVWCPASPEDESATQSQSITFHFNHSASLSSLTIDWDPDAAPARFTVALTTDDGRVETVAIVTQRRACQPVSFDKRTNVVAARISILRDRASVAPLSKLRRVVFHESGGERLHSPTETVLNHVQEWLFSASLFDDDQVRDTALLALQRFSLASGSLCGLLQVAISLIANSATGIKETKCAAVLDEQKWNRFDRLSDKMQKEMTRFLVITARTILKQMIDSDSAPRPGGNSLLDKRVLDDIKLAIEGRTELQQLKATDAHQPNTTRGAPDQFGTSESPLHPFISIMACQGLYTACLKRRSQVGLVLVGILSELAAWQMKRMQKAEEYVGKREVEMTHLEEPFSIEVRPHFFELSHGLLCRTLGPWLKDSSSTRVDAEADCNPEREDCAEKNEAKQSTTLYNLLEQSCADFGVDGTNYEEMPTSAVQILSPDAMCAGLLQIITSNTRRLVLSRVDPSEIGIEPAVINDSTILSAPPALNPMVATLEKLISLGAKRSDRFFPVSLKAAAAVEVGMEAFYPSANQRTKLLTSRMGRGATLEVQVRWPVQERDQEDPRYERLILMLQFECIRLGYQHAIRGRWHLFMHLVIQVPGSQATEEVLQQHFAPCIQKAGFSSWQVAAGAQEISINLQRHLHWNRVEKMSHDSGSGWIRVYPKDVAEYQEVLGDVEQFHANHDQRAATMARP